MLADHGDHDRVLDLEPVTGVGEILAAQAAVAARARQRGAAPLHRRAARRHPRRSARRARRQPARRPDAVPRRQGARRARRPRPRAARRRAGAAPAVLTHRLLLAPEAAGEDRATVVRDALERVPRAVRPMTRAPGAAAAWARRSCWRRWRSTPARCTCRAWRCCCLGVGAAAWVGLAARGAGIERVPGPPTVEEDRPYPLRLTRARRAAARARRRAGDRAARRADAAGRACPRAGCASTCASQRRGRRVLEPAVVDHPRPAAAWPRARCAPAARTPSCWCSRASSPCSRPAAPGAPARGSRADGRPGGRAARAPRARPPSWTSTACAPTARARPPRASTGRRWPAAARCSSGA